MACGCGGNPVDYTIHLPQFTDAERTRALVCHVCIYAEHGPSAWKDGAIRCGIDAKPVCGRTECPKGKFKGEDPVMVRSLWWHYGAAWWQRLAIWAFKGSRLKYNAFGGCGCIQKLKDLKTRWDFHSKWRGPIIGQHDFYPDYRVPPPPYWWTRISVREAGQAMR